MSSEALSWAFDLEDISPGAKLCAIMIANDGARLRLDRADTLPKLVKFTGCEENQVKKFLDELRQEGMLLCEGYAHYKLNLDEYEIKKQPYVYLMYSPKFDVYKIGQTVNLNRRITDIRKQRNDSGIKYITKIATDYPRVMESELHKHFADKCEGGNWSEWFELSDSDVEYIKGLAENE